MNPNRLSNGKFGSGKRIKIHCSICDKELIRTPAFVKGNKYYCSYGCQRNRGSSIVRDCLNCNKEIKTSKSLNQRYCSAKCYSLSGRRGEIHKGENNNNWRGGISPLNMQVRSDFKYKLWRKFCLDRDNYTCQICGKEASGKLNVDHYPKSFISIMVENNIRNIEEALDCDMLWDTDNGRTLCIDCHEQTDTYRKRYVYQKEVQWQHSNL